MATCSECTYMNFEKEHDCDGKYWCEKKYEWMRPESAECGRYCRAYSRDDNVSRSYRNYSKSKQSSGCYITTIVCETLGMNDGNIYLTLLRKFRKNYLQKKPEGVKILEEYDTIGPVIAHCIRMDEKKNEVAQGVFTQSIIPIIDDICEGKNTVAIEKYTMMTKGLIEKYGLETLTLSVPGVSAYDYKQDRTMMGHGQLVKRK